MWAVLLLIASSLLAAAAKHYDDEPFPSSRKSVCEVLDDTNHDSRCGQLIGGVVRLKWLVYTNYNCRLPVLL